MAEEVKNSSHKPGGGHRSSRENTFRLHYFPEIPIDGSESKRKSQGTASSFQRVRYNTQSPPGGGEASAAGPSASEHRSEQQITEIETRAYIQGFNKGESEGFAAAERKIKKALGQLAAQMNELTRLRRQIYEQTESEIVELVMAIVRKVVCTEIDNNPEVIVGVLAEALRKVESHQQLVVRVHPSDLEFLERNRLQMSGIIEEIEAVRLEADASIGRGGCLIQTEAGAIDARIERQIKVIEESFRSQALQGPDTDGAFVKNDQMTSE